MSPKDTFLKVAKTLIMIKAKENSKHYFSQLCIFTFCNRITTEKLDLSYIVVMLQQ